MGATSSTPSRICMKELISTEHYLIQGVGSVGMFGRRIPISTGTSARRTLVMASALQGTVSLSKTPQFAPGRKRRRLRLPGMYIVHGGHIKHLGYRLLAYECNMFSFHKIGSLDIFSLTVVATITCRRQEPAAPLLESLADRLRMLEQPQLPTDPALNGIVQTLPPEV